jgi:hypothetical protein
MLGMATLRGRHTTIARLIVAPAMLACVLAGCTDSSPSGEASTLGSGDLTSAPTTPSTGEKVLPPSGFQIVGPDTEGRLTPGRYALPPVGPLHGPLAVVDIPARYGAFGTFIYASQPPEPNDPLALGLWDVTGVYLNPCSQSNEVDTEATTLVSKVFDALSRQRLTSSTRLREVNVGGFHGIYVEVTTPTDLDLSRCDDAELNLWESRPDGGYWTRKPGMVERLWILDVHGQPMVLHMAVPPSATSAQIRAMTDILEAVKFKPPRYLTS